MQVTSINSINATKNNPAFGAKLKIYNCRKDGDFHIFSKAGKQLAYFSKSELRQVEKIFENRTKDINGTSSLHLNSIKSDIYGTMLCYADTTEGIRYQDSVALKLHHPKSEEKVPKSVPEFVDKLIGTLKAIQNRRILTKKIERLEQEIKILKTNRDNSTLSELSKYFEIVTP